MKEPEGTRMQVVKGFSDLNWGFLVDHLGPPYEKPPQAKYAQPRRHQLVCHYPKWEEDHWACSYVLDVHEDEPHIRPLVIFQFDPEGRCLLHLHDQQGEQVHYDAFTLRPQGDEPVRSYFWLLAESKQGAELASHLKKYTSFEPHKVPA